MSAAQEAFATELAYISKRARQMFRDAGFEKARIVASNALDEELMLSLNAQDADIDVYGVGTNLVTAEIEPALGNPRTGNVRRKTNRAGGLEGGMTTGEPLVLRVAMKPISTLMRPLQTVDVKTGETAAAAAERSDVTAVPAMGVIAEAMAALVLADAALEKFGGDSLGEFLRNHASYLARVAERLG